MRFRVFQLAFQYRGAGVRVCCPLLETVILLHGLVVQVLAVYHEQHLVDIGQLRCQPCRFERSQRFAGARGVPDVTAALDGAILFVVVGDLDAVQYPLGCRDLIWAHHHQHLFRGEDTIPGQNVQDRVLCKECPGKVDQIRQHTVIRIGPVGGKFKAIAGLFLFHLAVFGILDGIVAGAVGVVLGICAVGDHKNLHILI